MSVVICMVNVRRKYVEANVGRMEGERWGMGSKTSLYANLQNAYFCL